MAKDPNPLMSRRLRLKPFVGVVDLSQEREVTAKDLLRTRRKKKGKRKKAKSASARVSAARSASPREWGTPLPPHTSVNQAATLAEEREVTASDILKRPAKKRQF